MTSRIARRISVLFSKTLAYNTLNLITCMHQERIPNSVETPMGNTGEAIQIEYKKQNTIKFAYLMSRCWGNIDSLKKNPPFFASVIAAENINTDWVTLLHQVGGGTSWTCTWRGKMWTASERM